MTSFICSIQIINAAREAKSTGGVSDPNIFLWIVSSVTDATAVTPNGIKMLLANGLSKFLF